VIKILWLNKRNTPAVLAVVSVSGVIWPLKTVGAHPCARATSTKKGHRRGCWLQRGYLLVVEKVQVPETQLTAWFRAYLTAVDGSVYCGIKSQHGTTYMVAKVSVACSHYWLVNTPRIALS